MGFAELWEIGFFSLFWCFSTPILSAFAYAALVLGFVVQALLLAKSRTKAAKWAFAGFVVVSLVVCEVFCHAITGWARLGVLVLYGGAVCLLLGALAAALLWQLRKK